MSSVTSEHLMPFTKLFEGLSIDELVLIAGIVRREVVDAGTVIITEGETGGDLFLLEEGTVEVLRTLTIVTSKHEFGARERSFSRLTGEDHCIFGETGIIGRGERTATVKAASNCTLLVIDAKAFLTLVKVHPNIGYIVVTNIARMLAAYLRKANDDVIKLTTALSLALSG
jgi:CRP/FNR family transcriptional regulator, cyclic AMP receptor protein